MVVEETHPLLRARVEVVQTHVPRTAKNLLNLRIHATQHIQVSSCRCGRVTRESHVCVRTGLATKAASVSTRAESALLEPPCKSAFATL